MESVDIETTPGCSEGGTDPRRLYLTDLSQSRVFMTEEPAVIGMDSLRSMDKAKNNQRLRPPRGSTNFRLAASKVLGNR